jgi:hypothetical protein
MCCLPLIMWPTHAGFAPAVVAVQAPDDEAVWRQLMRLHLDNRDPDVAQQAAAE